MVNLTYSTAQPDMKFINRHVPILEVAKALGLTVQGKKAKCPTCGKKRLTFNVRLNCWRCWECDLKGERKSAIDLVMFCLKVSCYDAAKWICERWNMVGKVQMERSENTRGITKHVYSRWRPIPIPERDKPSLQAIVSSPGWCAMSPATGKVILTLFGLTDADGKVVMSRGELRQRTGITSSRSLAKANSELETTGLFQIDRGYKTKYAERPTTYRLSWYSQAFQKWLKNGNSPDVPDVPQGHKVGISFAPSSIPTTFTTPTTVPV